MVMNNRQIVVQILVLLAVAAAVLGNTVSVQFWYLSAACFGGMTALVLYEATHRRL